MRENYFILNDGVEDEERDDDAAEKRQRWLHAAFAFPFGGNNASCESQALGSSSSHYAGKTVESVGVAAFVATPTASTVHVINFMSA